VKIFVYEHITGGGSIGAPLSEALLPEAMLMLRALVSDLVDAGADVAALCDDRLEIESPATEVRLVGDTDDWESGFEQLAHAADAVWLLAPETGGVLESRSRRVIALGRTQLGSKPDAIRIAASKSETAHALRRAGVPVVPTFRWHEVPDIVADSWVAKPDDGCGCEATRLFPDARSARDWIETQTAPGHFALQPYLRGEPLSLSVLASEGRAWLLSVNRQQIAVDDRRFAFLGSEVGAMADSEGMFARLAERIAQAIPGLWGYFGIDLILAGSSAVVLEINPRLTTSYAGLRAAVGVNPAGLVLRLFEGRELPAIPPPRRSVVVDVQAHAAQLPGVGGRVLDLCGQVQTS
jgi:predicted ATP-grasp superfamily ATP-dependent carboligase